MKVTEVACILGAWAHLSNSGNQVLDIGTGTGILSLMLAQRCRELEITAIDIDPLACEQASENIISSVFSHQIEISQTAIQAFYPEKLFHTIICNPPFFEDQLQSKQSDKNTAWHSTQLTLHELITHIKRLMHPDGLCNILYPIERWNDFQQCLQIHQISIKNILWLIPHEKSIRKYFIAVLSKETITQTKAVDLVIKTEGIYSSPMRNLMTDFYLAL